MILRHFASRSNRSVLSYLERICRKDALRISISNDLSRFVRYSHTSGPFRISSLNSSPTLSRRNTLKILRSKRVQTVQLPRNRPFSTTHRLQHGDLTPPKPGEERHITFIDKEGQEHTFEVADGDNLLDIAQANDLEMEGACGGSCACSTCHVIVKDDEMYDKMEEPSDDENDMLDLAFGLTETSRLGCQVQMSKDLDGLVVSTFGLPRDAV